MEVLRELAEQCGTVHIPYAYSAQRMRLVEDEGMVILGHCLLNNKFQHAGLPPGWYVETTERGMFIVRSNGQPFCKYYEVDGAINLTAA